MKRFFLFLLASISMLLVACDSDTNFTQEDNIPLSNLSLQPKTWQEQLEYVKNKNHSEKPTRSNNFNTHNIIYMGYTHKGKIETNIEKRETIDGLFSEHSTTIQYTDASNYEIVPMKMIIQKAKALGSLDPFAKVRSQLEATVQVGMELIEIEWLYKGQKIYSTAIASNNHGGIIYDNIGHLILAEVQPDTQIDMIFNNKPLIKTRTEPGSGEDGEVMRQFRLSDRIVNGYNVEVVSYSINCFSFFNKKGILYDRNLNKRCYSAPGWDCQVGLQTISGDINSSSFHEFAWAYAYGISFTVSLNWNGAGFTVKGSSNAVSGTEVHRGNRII